MLTLEGGGRATYAFGVFEDGRCVAGYAWQPPPFGSANAVCPEFHHGVLSLSRMVAVPKEHRKLKHVSKPLMVQMKTLIDRRRWPVLITYSDSSVGHTGYVYQCSGFEKTSSRKVKMVRDESGQRVSQYQNGLRVSAEGMLVESATIQRWEHWACERGTANTFAADAGWRVVALAGKVWASGKQAHKVIRQEPADGA